MKKSIALIICITLAVVSIFSLILYNKANKTNNTAINDSPKIVGSKSSQALDRAIITSIDRILEVSDLIIIGKVVSPGVTELFDFPFPNQVLKKKAEMNSSGPMKLGTCKSEIKIGKVLYGNANASIVFLSQLGVSGNDSGETKVKNGQKLLLILSKHRDKDNYYSSVDFENGIFAIDNASKVLSFSDNKAVAKYDNLDLSILEKDIIDKMKTIKNR